MANVVINGIYSSKSVLDAAEAATAEAGDSYLVGTKMPYDLYTYSGRAFKKIDKVSTVSSEEAGPAEVQKSDLFKIIIKDGEKKYKIRCAVGRGARCDTFELYGV